MRVNSRIISRLSGLFVFLTGVLLIVNFVWGGYVGLYIRDVIVPHITFVETGKLPAAVEDEHMSAAGVAMLHTLPFNNSKLIKSVALEKKLSEGFLDIYDISNGSSLSALDEQKCCVNVRSNPVYKICIYDTKKDVYISGSLRGGGKWEADITNLLQSAFKQSKQLTFVDIGANIGYFSLLSASLGHYAVAVEPWEQHLQKLAQSIYLNKFQDKITVLRNAVSDYHRVGYLDIHIAKIQNQGAAQLFSDNKSLTSDDFVTTSTIQLDDLVPLLPTTNIILKFDIEGHECRAIEKSSEIFDNFNVTLILTEWMIMKHDMNKNGIACPPDKIQQMADMLSNRGFVPYAYPNQLIDVKKPGIWKHSNVYWKPKK